MTTDLTPLIELLQSAGRDDLAEYATKQGEEINNDIQHQEQS
jgi:hypothetical protein